MKAAVLRGPRDLRIEPGRAPDLGAGEVLVRVGMAAVNAEPTPQSRLYTHSLLGKSGEILPRLL